ncbi:Autophagy-related protein [Wickerhamomyces ciferrii]|uniref:Autophagy-related protein n=1 Tax=Wickerhamomyces ciferrii (strain ATCC 14091 / BCRC 22168 / CBS 111 / JCM 3599 / NBRC 0793 / NRRL Y-1031 F-60-10) TaxID=1206466 RepID=K0KKC9_WICCF|nr:Autophagy-related protein [Wickerhamomyces ciferrii]CCH45675.1 Autophagy-related protein [Wickerhamomyces ciferrii]
MTKQTEGPIINDEERKSYDSITERPNVHSVGSQSTSALLNNEVDPQDESNIWSKKTIYRAWLLLCFTTGPVASMSRTYVPATIQSVARSVGKTSTGEKCGLRGNDCFVKFGTGLVHYSSYVLYLKAIYTALEGVVALLLMGIADYSNYRKWILITSVALYGCFALPFAGLTDKTYAHLRGLSALYGLLNVDNAIYQILEGSYIPLFMRAAVPAKRDNNGDDQAGHQPEQVLAEDVRRSMVLKRGSTVSVMGIFLGNCGGMTALLIGIIISYGRGTPQEDGYHNFLLAITIAGCVTVVFSMISSYYIPSTKGKPLPKGEFLQFLTFKRMYGLIKQIRKYPNAFILCIAWVIWNVSFNNFMMVWVLLFRSTLGIGNSDSEYTVYTWMSYVLASLGSLAWMFAYPRTRLTIKQWAYSFLSISFFTNFWGCLGINSNTKVGFKHRWEFWVFEVFYSASSSAMRSLNRTLYSSMLPEGEEAQYFGLEIMLGVAVGWIGDLVNATIQDRTGNDRYPFLPNLFLVLISLILYAVCDSEQEMRDVKKIREEEE